MHDVQVGVAGAGARDLDDDLAWARYRDLDIDNLGLGLPGEELYCAHVMAFLEKACRDWFRQVDAMLGMLDRVSFVGAGIAGSPIIGCRFVAFYSLAL